MKNPKAVNLAIPLLKEISCQFQTMIDCPSTMRLRIGSLDLILRNYFTQAQIIYSPLLETSNQAPSACFFDIFAVFLLFLFFDLVEIYFSITNIYQLEKMNEFTNSFLLKQIEITCINCKTKTINK